MKNFLRRLVVASSLLIATYTFVPDLIGQPSNTSTFQFIHASADPALSPIDVMAGLSPSLAPIIQNGSFGNASAVLTTFSSISVDNALNLRLTANVTYPSQSASARVAASLPFVVGQSSNVVIALGNLRPFLLSTNPSLKSTELQLIQLYDTTSVVLDSTVRLLLVHGVTDAPRVDVVIRETGAVLAKLEYTQSAVAVLPLSDYTVDIRYSTSQSVIASFGAPLQSLSLGGQRITCVVGGFLSPKKNQDGPPISVIVVPTKPLALDSVRTVTSAFLPFAQGPVVVKNPRTRIQIIDNSADAARAPLNTFLIARAPNSTTTTVAPLGQALRFRQATQTISTTPLITVQIVNRVPVVTQVVLDLDNVVGSQISAVPQRFQPGRPINLANLPSATLSRGWNKVIATGMLDTTDYTKNPDGISIRTQFTSFIDPVDSVAPDSVRLLLFQGVTDAKRMSVDIRGGDSLAVLRYTEGRFVTLPAQAFTFDFTTFGTDEVIGSFLLPLDTYAGQRISVMTSGFINPLGNSNGQPLGLLLVPESPSTTNRITLLNPAPSLTGVAETTLQSINASADGELLSIGTAVGFPIGTNASTFLPVTSQLSFRKADTAVAGLGTFAPFLKDIAGVSLTSYITRPRAVSANTPLYQSSRFSIVRGTNIWIVSGLQRPYLYAQNPDNLATNTGLYQFVDKARVIAPDSVRLLLFHSVTDAPTVDILVRGTVDVPSVTLATLAYGQGTWLTVPLADYTLDVAAAGKTTVLASYGAPLASLALGGQRLTISATGFLNPAKNQWFPGLGLYAASNGASLKVVSTQTTSQTTSIDALPGVQLITATGSTISTSSMVISTSANGQTTTTITISKTIFTPNPVSGNTRTNPVFPTTSLVVATTTFTVTTTINVQYRSDVTTSSVLLYTGAISATTLSTVQIYSTNSSLVLSQMLPAVDKPVQSAAGIAAKEDNIANAAAFPNPAAGDASILYTLKSDAVVDISLYDSNGQFISSLETSKAKNAGSYKLDFTTQNLQSGLYEARIVTERGAKTVKVYVVR